MKSSALVFVVSILVVALAIGCSQNSADTASNVVSREVSARESVAMSTPVAALTSKLKAKAAMPTSPTSSIGNLKPVVAAPLHSPQLQVESVSVTPVELPTLKRLPTVAPVLDTEAVQATPSAEGKKAFVIPSPAVTSEPEDGAAPVATESVPTLPDSQRKEAVATGVPQILKSAIRGTMKIDFGTRSVSKEGTDSANGKDSYTVKLMVGDGYEFSGQVTRKPFVASGIIKNEEPEKLLYSITVSWRDPLNLESAKRAVGKLLGVINITSNGVYGFGDSSSNELRLETTYPREFQGRFGGRILGKRKGNEESVTAKLRRYTRFFGGKMITIEKSNLDPLGFQDLILPGGPLDSYPETKVTGNLDYDYETGNWLTNGISFEYRDGGKLKRDLVTGSIKWVEDSNRKVNGKGYYDFNLRFNEEEQAKDEGAAFEEVRSLDEGAFFEVDTSVPSIVGKVNYVDKIVPVGEEDVVTSSEVSYQLESNWVSKIQLMNFFKLWLVIIGPVNDE